MINNKIWNVVLFLGLLPVLLACSSGDDDNGVVGTWKGYRCDNISTLEISENHTLTLVFSSNGFGNYLEIDNPYTEQCTFTYEMESNTRGKADTKVRGIIYFEIMDNKMYVYGHGYGNDLDFLLTKQ
jgi:hypothetical protein